MAEEKIRKVEMEKVCLAGRSNNSDSIERQKRGFELIRAVLNPFTAEPRLTDISTGGRDWAAAYDFAVFHGVRPVLHRAMSGMDNLDQNASEIFEALDNFQRFHSLRVMQTTSEIVVLAQAFERAGIKATFFKGAILAKQVYAGIQNREFSDIDVLIGPAQRVRAEEVLTALEFQPIIRDVHFRRAFFDHNRQHNFVHFESGSMVDFHWGFVGLGQFPISVKDALDDSVKLDLAGTKVYSPGPESLGLILAGHGHKENWASFGWILDFAMFALANSTLDWSRLKKKARSRGCVRAVLTAHLLVERTFGFTIDENSAEEARTSLAIVRNVKRIASDLEALAVRRLGDDLMGGFRFCETPMQKLRVALGLLTSRTIGDFEAMPLGAPWWWVYRFTRPIRLTNQAILGRSPGMTEAISQKGYTGK